VKRRRRLYIPLKFRVAATIAAGMLWFLFSLWLSRSWIKTLGERGLIAYFLKQAREGVRGGS